MHSLHGVGQDKYKTFYLFICEAKKSMVRKKRDQEADHVC